MNTIDRAYAYTTRQIFTAYTVLITLIFAVGVAALAIVV